MSGQCTATFGSPGRAPSAISSMLGCVAAVSATESPSQLSPALIHKMWSTSSCEVPAAWVAVSVMAPHPPWVPTWVVRTCRARRPASSSRHLPLVEPYLHELPEHVVHGRLRLLDAVHRGRGHHEQVVDRARLGHPAALVAGQPHGQQAAAPGLVEPPEQ